MSWSPELILSWRCAYFWAQCWSILKSKRTRALQMTARKKQKSHAPAYCASVTGVKAFEKMCIAEFCVLNVISIAIAMLEVSVAIDIPDMVEVILEIEDDDTVEISGGLDVDTTFGRCRFRGRLTTPDQIWKFGRRRPKMGVSKHKGR